MATDKQKDREQDKRDSDDESVVILQGGPRRRWPDDGVRVEKGAR